MSNAYTITFCSFTNRIGRTMALVKVGEELAQRGKKVLLVDLNLNSPGLHMFDLLRPKEPHPGMMEYVTDYLETERSPAVKDYLYKGNGVYQAGWPGNQAGELWVMSAGRDDVAYWKALTKLNWVSLYEEHGGFRFFEDTRLQWQEAIHPDYVLIDAPYAPLSPGNICTRQFANAVALFVYPDEQTLADLNGICQSTLRDLERSHGPRITLYAVLDNLPPEALPANAGFKQSGVELVSQNLADIRQLTDKLVSQHWDRKDVLHELQRMSDHISDLRDGCVDVSEYVQQLETWENHFAEDPVMLDRMADIFSSVGLLRDALRCRRQALDGLLTPGERTVFATILAKRSEVEGEKFLNACLSAILYEAPPPSPPSPPPDPSRFSYESISCGDFHDVLEELKSKDISTLPTEAVFNLAMVYWAASDDLRPPLLQLVVQKSQAQHQGHPNLPDASECQMLSLAYYGLGEKEKALECLKNADQAVNSGARVKSYWRYGPEVDANLFWKDCLEIQRMIEGERSRPFFFKLAQMSRH